MSSFQNATKLTISEAQEVLRVRKNLVAIISREVKAGNQNAIVFLEEAMRRA